jgi:aspartyl-tRNA(Asn)/glutamyl-tRNA(Gln) amidotransferase subunit B
MYIPVIGLEIHVQIKSNSKMFCRCSADYFGKEPNSNVCPVCMGMPGALPVPNKVAFEKAVKLALALECSINQKTKFDRKNYFYPDLPKGYQISQFDQPIGENGYVEIEVEGDNRRVRVQRVHLEEDTGKSTHDVNSLGENKTLLDYNKSGIALLEIVTYPEFESVDEVIAFAKRLRQIVRYVGLSDAEMQKGQMRFELNISVKKVDEKGLPSYKVEVKNIGSISVLEKVLKFEVERQSSILEKGEVIKSQTRGLKDMTGETLFQRTKESADDYRYFPEPDIPPIFIGEDFIHSLKEELPELPAMRKQRYIDIGLEYEQADIFVEDVERGDWFDKLLEKVDLQDKVLIKEYAKWVVGEISGQLEKRSLSIRELPIKVDDLIYIVHLVKQDKISGTIAKQVINIIFENGKNYKSAEQIISDRNLIQISDSSEVEGLVNQVIMENPKVVSDLSKNPNVIKFLVGQVMKLSKGKVNPKVAEDKLRESLGIKS